MVTQKTPSLGNQNCFTFFLSITNAYSFTCLQIHIYGKITCPYDVKKARRSTASNLTTYTG